MSKRISTFAACAFCFSCVAEQEGQPQPHYPWLDTVHNKLTSSVSESALWFDDFFASEGAELGDAATGQARVTLSWEPRSTDWAEFDSRFRVRFRLPNLKHKADLVFSDYDEEERNAPIQAATNEAVGDSDELNLALRWTTDEGKRSSWRHRVGVGRGFQAFAKSRYRRYFAVSKQSHLRWDTSLYYYSKDGLGSHIEAQYEHQLANDSLLRWDNHFYFRDEFNDWIWQHGLYHFHYRDEKTAWVKGIYLEGNSKPNYRAEEYLVSVRWRKNALRQWLYFEVEPFVVWRRDEGFNTSLGIALRVEGFFGQ